MVTSLDLNLANFEDEDENDQPALLSARNSALSLVDSLFSDDDDNDEPDMGIIDSTDMLKLRYSIGTNGDRRHLLRDIHGAHKQAEIRGLDLGRALKQADQSRQAARADSEQPGLERLRIPISKPSIFARAKSCGAFATLLPFKRKSEPPESIRAAAAARPTTSDSPPRPRKTVSFADLRDDVRAASAAAGRSGRDEDDTDSQAACDLNRNEDVPAPPQPVQMDEWGAPSVWGWEQLPSGGAPQVPLAPSMVMPTAGGGAYFLPGPQQVATIVYPDGGVANYHAEPAHGGYYAPMQLLPQMGQAPQMQVPNMAQMAWPIPQMQMPMQMPMAMAMPMPMPMPMQMPMPQNTVPPPAAAMAAAPPPSSPPLSTRGRGAAGNRSHHHAAAGHASGRTRGALLVAAKEQQGSRRLQAELSRMSDAQLDGACAELAPYLLELSKHTFGNYVVSKLAARPQAQPHLLAALRGHVVELLQHAQGSRVVQATIAALPAADAATLVAELDGHVFECALDTHGSWGVCVAFKQTHAEFIVAQMARNMAALATQQHGIRVVQQVLNEAAACGMSVSGAVGALLEGELGFIAAHAYGNYAVQAALRHAATAQRDAMLAALLPRLLALSRSKHGSNVAEMVLMRASPAQLEQIRGQIFGVEQPEQLRELMESQYGNYVLQALLRRLDAGQRAAALQLIEAATSTSNFGRAIIAAAAAAA